jgi:hypothetical protein
MQGNGIDAGSYLEPAQVVVMSDPTVGGRFLIRCTVA